MVLVPRTSPQLQTKRGVAPPGRCAASLGAADGWFARRLGDSLGTGSWCGGHLPPPPTSTRSQRLSTPANGRRSRSLLLFSLAGGCLYHPGPFPKWLSSRRRPHVSAQQSVLCSRWPACFPRGYSSFAGGEAIATGPCCPAASRWPSPNGRGRAAFPGKGEQAFLRPCAEAARPAACLSHKA